MDRAGLLLGLAVLVVCGVRLTQAQSPGNEHPGDSRRAGAPAPSARAGDTAMPAVPQSNGVGPAWVEAIRPLPQIIDVDTRKLALGERLFGEARLSGDGLVSCTSCHVLELGATNRQPFSTLPNRGPVAVNVPTLYNVAFVFRYAWNGRYEQLNDQLDFAMTTPNAMGSSWQTAVQRLSSDASYRAAFTQAYPNTGLTPANVRDALAEYCRSLITPDSVFDQALRGEMALPARAQRGYEAFRDYGCISCHQGQGVGGNMFQRLGVMADYFADRGHITQADLGRYNTTGREQDRYVFRVPSLRNVALTAPYFHDGSAASLEEAVQVMGRYQLGRELNAEETGDIAAFLRTLTGKYRGKAL